MILGVGNGRRSSNAANFSQFMAFLLLRRFSQNIHDPPSIVFVLKADILSGCSIACSAICRNCVDMSSDLLVSLIFPSDNMRQTLEVVQVKVAGSLVQFSAADFLHLNLRNLSREGFGLAVTFGIDYRHQAICLDQVPQRFHDALRETFAHKGLDGEVAEILVEFKEAGASSLDYFIYLTMKGSAAGLYYKLGRLVQQTCVDVCNREGWGIPFPQLTIHQGDGGVEQT